jgi:UDP-N-acetyl-2-amino-2-deoxyglucuronate dehydrogenase
MSSSTHHSSLATRHFFVGIIGAGNISQTHAQAVRVLPNATFSAVYGTNPEKTRRLAAEHNATPYKDLDAFLRHRPMHLVILGSPSALHSEQGIAAAQHGLHVLTEKPIDISTARADALISAAQQNNVQLAVIFQDRTKPHIRQLKTWLDSGALGKPLFVDAHLRWYRPSDYYANSRWRGTQALDGGGALINQGIHTIDLLVWLLGDVARVQARTATLLHKIEAEDTALATLEFASGALGTFYATTAAFPGYPRRIEISGTAGSVILEQDRILSANFRNPPPDAAAFLVSLPSDCSDRSSDRPVAAAANQSASSPAISDIRGHQLILEDFLHSIEHRHAPICNGPEARRSLALVESIYRAAKANP